MKKSILAIICIVMFLSIGCSKSEEEIDYSNLPDVFGIELYNIEVGLFCENDDKKNFDFNFMSKIDIPLDSKIIMEYDGGTMNYSYKLEEMESSIGKYSLYHIALNCKDISIDNDRLNISSVKIQYDKNGETEVISMNPQKLSIVHVFDAHDDDRVYFESYGTLLPYGMDNIPYNIYTKEELISVESGLTNTSLKVINGSEFKDIFIGKDKSSNSISIKYNIEKNDLAKYTEYRTSIIFSYKINEEENAILSNDVIYNFCKEENLSKYFEEVLLKK